jgi:predicted Zn-dependent peptidase
LEKSIISRLKNGLRIVYIPYQHSDIIHLCLTIGAGTRHENKQQQGLAHFIEHCLFKGTEERTSYKIISELDEVGGELNAYTTKEETCLYASFRKPYTEKAFSLLSDITFHSTFPEKEINKEKTVVIDEILSYLDSPAERIFDEYESMLFAGSSLGHNILGTIEHVQKFNRKMIFEYLAKNYRTNNMVLAISGNIKAKEFIALSEKYFAEKKYYSSATINKPYTSIKNKPFEVKHKLPIHQCHAIIGTRAYSAKNKKRLAFSLLNNYLGGHGMNNRLNILLREKNGLVYSIESNYAPYSDTGMFAIYFGTDHKNLDKCLSLIYKELKHITRQKISKIKFEKIKEQYKGLIALAEENRLNRLLGAGKSILLYNKIFSTNEIYKKIDAITIDEFMQVSNEILDENKLSLLIYIPEN